MPKEYVLGFLFNLSGTSVALIRKEKPEWQKGRWNGIGGKVEMGESPLFAMPREFKEETGVDIFDWTPFATLSGTGFVVYCFSAKSDEVYNVKTMEEEQVDYFYVGTLPSPRLPNIQWMIQMALSFGEESATLLDVREVA